MQPSDLEFSPTAFNATLTQDIFVATQPAEETRAAGQARMAAIVEHFRTYDPGDIVEATIVSHIITFHFHLRAALRDVGMAQGDEKAAVGRHLILESPPLESGTFKIPRRAL